jgi:hypothetical protein
LKALVDEERCTEVVLLMFRQARTQGLYLMVKKIAIENAIKSKLNFVREKMRKVLLETNC